MYLREILEKRNKAKVAKQEARKKLLALAQWYMPNADYVFTVLDYAKMITDRPESTARVIIVDHHDNGLSKYLKDFLNPEIYDVNIIKPNEYNTIHPEKVLVEIYQDGRKKIQLPEDDLVTTVIKLEKVLKCKDGSDIKKIQDTKLYIENKDVAEEIIASHVLSSLGDLATQESHECLAEVKQINKEIEEEYTTGC